MYIYIYIYNYIIIFVKILLLGCCFFWLFFSEILYIFSSFFYTDAKQHVKTNLFVLCRHILKVISKKASYHMNICG